MQKGENLCCRLFRWCVGETNSFSLSSGHENAGRLGMLTIFRAFSRSEGGYSSAKGGAGIVMMTMNFRFVGMGTDCIVSCLLAVVFFLQHQWMPNAILLLFLTIDIHDVSH
jgi:hypothetical protein